MRRVHAAGPVVRLDIYDEDMAIIQAEVSQQQHALLRLVPGAQVYVAPRVVRVFQSEYSI